jgi:hypothetical protein
VTISTPKYCYRQKQVPGKAVSNITDVSLPTTTTPIPVPPVPVPPVPVPPLPKNLQVPALQSGGLTIDERLKNLGPVTYNPIAIHIGNQTKSPVLTTFSPWFRYQFSRPGIGKIDLPRAYIEVDERNVEITRSFEVTGVPMENSPIPLWGDTDNIRIGPNELYFNNANFRWITLDKDSTGLYQVSRFPFSANASQWQDRYVFGLVASGPVEKISTHKNNQEFHYFSLNFAQVANHNPRDPPYYTGFANIDETIPGQGRSKGLAKVPFLSYGFWFSEKRIGQWDLPVPSGFTAIPLGELTEADLGYPNRDLILACTPSTCTVDNPANHPDSRQRTQFDEAVAGSTQTFYVRVVPFSKNGVAGTPTLPVTVTVARPHPCPKEIPPDVTNTIFIRPPSVEIVSFYMNSLVPNPSPPPTEGARVVTVASPLYCSPPPIDLLADQWSVMCGRFGGSTPGYHTYTDPVPEESWWDKVVDAVTSVFSFFTGLIDSVSAAWASINAFVVNIAAKAVSGLTGIDCSDPSICNSVLSGALSSAEMAVGIPPTLPNSADLESMGADYMAKVAAEEIGAEDIVDASDIKFVGQKIGNAVSEQSNAQVASSSYTWLIPDPLYYETHPAYVFVNVSNPNSVDKSDVVRLRVTDSGGFYSPSKEYVVPPLEPGGSTIIPVILEENFEKGYTKDCFPLDAVQKSSGDGGGWPCYWRNWANNAYGAGTDELVPMMVLEHNGSLYTASSLGSSTDLGLLMDDEGKICTWNTRTTNIQIPESWATSQSKKPLNFHSLMWNQYIFSNPDGGASGHLIGS